MSRSNDCVRNLKSYFSGIGTNTNKGIWFNKNYIRLGIFAKSFSVLNTLSKNLKQSITVITEVEIEMLLFVVPTQI